MSAAPLHQTNQQSYRDCPWPACVWSPAGLDSSDAPSQQSPYEDRPYQDFHCVGLKYGEIPLPCQSQFFCWPWAHAYGWAHPAGHFPQRKPGLLPWPLLLPHGSDPRFQLQSHHSFLTYFSLSALSLCHFPKEKAGHRPTFHYIIYLIWDPFAAVFLYRLQSQSRVLGHRTCHRYPPSRRFPESSGVQPHCGNLQP